MSTMFYIISISLQIAGALLLVIFAISTKRRKVVERFVNKDMVFEDGNTNEISYNKEELKQTFKVAYLSKLSFFYIALGYLVGIWGENKELSNITITIAIIGVTAIIMLASYFIVEQILKYSKKVNKKLTCKELKEYGINSTMVSISNKEIYERFSDYFNPKI